MRPTQWTVARNLDSSYTWTGARALGVTRSRIRTDGVPIARACTSHGRRISIWWRDSRWKVAIEYEGRQHAEWDQFGRDIDRFR
jgi:hypothetical protein